MHEKIHCIKSKKKKKKDFLKISKAEKLNKPWRRLVGWKCSLGRERLLVSVPFPDGKHGGP